MNAYSSDLRERIAQAYDEGAGSQRTLAARFRISRTFVERLLRRRRETGSLAALPRSGGQRSALDAAALRLVARLVRQQGTNRVGQPGLKLRLLDHDRAAVLFKPRRVGTLMVVRRMRIRDDHRRRFAADHLRD